MSDVTQDRGFSPAQQAPRVRAGDADALAQAFTAVRQRLWRAVILRMEPRLAQRVDADDVLQEAYLAARSRQQHFSGETDEALFIWLRMICLQTLIDVRRRHLGAQMRDAGREAPRAARDVDATTITLLGQLAGTLTSPTGAIRRAESIERLYRVLDTVGEHDREILMLRHFEQLSNNEAAAALELTPQAASVRYIRALRRVQQELGGGSDVLSAARRRQDD